MPYWAMIQFILEQPVFNYSVVCNAVCILQNDFVTLTEAREEEKWQKMGELEEKMWKEILYLIMMGPELIRKLVLGAQGA